MQHKLPVIFFIYFIFNLVYGAKKKVHVTNIQQAFKYDMVIQV